MNIYSEQQITRLSDQERARQAKRKRAIQLQKWAEYDKKMEKEFNKKQVKVPGGPSAMNATRNVRFHQSLVLLEAAARGDLDEVWRLLHEGVCPDVANEDGLTALHQCCIDDNKELCSVLLQYAANVNARDAELWTPLHAAAACGHTEICRLLIEKGADLLALNADGNMPYDICEHDPTVYCIESAMAEKGISQEDIDEKRRIPECKMLEAVEEMHRAKKDLNQLDHQGAAFLHIAAASGFVDVASSLLNWNAKIDVLDKDGWRPIHVAACWGQNEIIEILAHYGEDMNALTQNGESIFDLCEDENLKRELYRLRDELEQRNQRLHGTRASSQRQKGLVRRRSSNNPRGSSIRRSSMREKNELSRKEAQQEKAGMLLTGDTINGSSNGQLNLPDSLPFEITDGTKPRQPSKNVTGSRAPGQVPNPSVTSPTIRNGTSVRSATLSPPLQERNSGQGKNGSISKGMNGRDNNSTHSLPAHIQSPALQGGISTNPPPNIPPVSHRPSNEFHTGQGYQSRGPGNSANMNGRMFHASSFPTSPSMSPVYAQPTDLPSGAYFSNPTQVSTIQRNQRPTIQNGVYTVGQGYLPTVIGPNAYYQAPRMSAPRSASLVNQDSAMGTIRKPISQPVKPMIPQTHPRTLISNGDSNEWKNKTQASGKCCVIM